MSALRARRLLRAALAAVVLVTAPPAAAAPPAAPSGAGPPALPGALPHPPDVQARIDAALAAAAPGEVARTRHIDAAGQPLYSNRLLLEASPYLQQHAHNPVDWYPWGDEAFARARELDRPVLVSIGYSTCHWCHVMEEESFDDVETARLLNSSFVAIKVDREARPDIDALYMAAANALGERGGWPLNVFLTPQGEPFFAGTYFPPEDGHGRPSFRRVLTAVAREWRERPERLREVAGQLGGALREALETPATTTSAPTLGREAVLRSVEATWPHVDDEWGGVGHGMKFPSSLPLRLWMRAEREAPAAPAARIRRAVTRTLDAMAAGGIHDFIGGGFHRYATDRRWRIPHFEKMLYDNAMLAVVYTEAWQWSGDERYARVARDTLAYLDREMSAPGGCFYSATDADSRSPSGELEEGRYFTWTPAELRAALPEGDARIVAAWWDVDAQGEIEGRNVLHTVPGRSESEVAGALGIDVAALRASLARSRTRLRAVRSKRPPPARDEKCIAAWNGLAISAFAQAGFALDDEVLVERAERAARFLLGTMRDEQGLHRVALGGRASGPAFLSDHAFAVAGLLDLYEATGAAQWLEGALSLQRELDAGYADAKGGGYYRSAHHGERLLAREKPMSDGALPSGNAVAARNLLRLHHLTGDAAQEAAAEAILSAFATRLERDPTAAPSALLALDMREDAAREVVVVEPEAGDAAGMRAMLAALRRGFVPKRVLAPTRAGKQQQRVARVAPLVASKPAQGGRPTAYVCRARVCQLPTTDPAALAHELGL